MILLALLLQAADPSGLAVMSFNIRYGTAADGLDAWPGRRGMVAEVIRRHQPDLVGLQEALRFQLDELRADLPGYAEIGVGREDGDTLGEYAAILFRPDRFSVLAAGTFWLSDTPGKPGSRHWGNRITRICTWARFRDRQTGRTFHLYNLHLDHESAPSRARSAALLAARIAARDDGGPVIVTGDFNAGEASRPLVLLRKRAGLRDSYRDVHPAPSDAGTFHAFRGTPLSGKIDFILVDRHWTVRAAAIDPFAREGRFPSDHFPVTAEVALQP